MTQKLGFNLLGLEINPLYHEQLLSKINEWISSKEIGHMVVFANTHVVMENRNNESLNEALQKASLIIPDGMPLVVIARMRGYELKSRPDGPGFMEKAMTNERYNHWRHYILGGTEEVLNRLIASYPDVLIVGKYSLPFRQTTSEEDLALIAEINASNADVLWVGLGCPKQEIWIAEHLNQLRVPVMLGVGQAFDILARVKPRAPEWMQNNGLEWFYRLLNEPKRVWKRYLLYNPQFIILVTLEEFHLRSANLYARLHKL